MEATEKLIKDTWDTVKTPSMHTTEWRRQNEWKQFWRGNGRDYPKSDYAQISHHIQKLTKMDHRPNVRTKTVKVYNSYNSAIKRQTTQLKNGQNMWTETLPKKIHRCKDVQHHLSLENCKLKQWGYHCTPIRMATIQNPDNANHWTVIHKGKDKTKEF